MTRRLEVDRVRDDELELPATPRAAHHLVLHGYNATLARYLVEDVAARRTYALSQTVGIALELCDGTRDRAAIAAELSKRVGAPFDPPSLDRILARLRRSELLAIDLDARSRPRPAARGLVLDLSKWRPLLAVLGGLLFRGRSSWIVAAAGLVGLIRSGWELPMLVRASRSALGMPELGLTLALGVAVTPIIAVLHELGHVLAMLAFSGVIPPIRFQLSLQPAHTLIPTARLWAIASRAQRDAVCLAGVYLQLLAAAVVVSIWAEPGSSASTLVRQLCLATTLVNVGTAIKCLVPMLPALGTRRSDGYLALAHVLGVAQLDAHVRARGTHSLWAWLGFWTLAVPTLAASAQAIAMMHASGVPFALILATWMFLPYVARSMRCAWERQGGPHRAASSFASENAADGLLRARLPS
jgi:hypothetical protein